MTQAIDMISLLRYFCAQVSMLDADRLNWQERYQESLKRSTPASPAHSLPISRAATHGTPQTSPFNSRPGGSDRAQSMVAAGQAEPTDDLDKLIRFVSTLGPCYSVFSETAQSLTACTCKARQSCCL